MTPGAVAVLLASPLVRLADVSPADRARVGGKAAHLARLARRRLPVPAAAVVPVDAFVRVLEHNRLLERAQALQTSPDPAAADALARRLLRAELPSGWERALVRGARRLGERLAVRSSAVDEDGATRSFAGQYLTRLAVRPEEVPDAVRACWASLYDPTSLAYRQGAGPPAGGMAVVIQELVEPVASGVLFTVNPLSGSWREMVVEATWGLGEGLVAGHVAPHGWVVRRPRRAPRPVQAVLSRVRLQVVQEDLPEIAEQWVVREGAVQREPVPAARGGRRTLERDTLLRLCRLGLRVEAEMDGPQDVEWALAEDGSLLVLQSRPITGAGRPRREEPLYTRRFIGERWPDLATPLGWSIMGPLLEHFVAYPETQARRLGGGPATKLVRSRPYMNVTVFRHLAFKLPGAPPPAFMMEFLPPEEERDWQRRFAMLPDLAVYASILRETFAERRWQRFRWNPLTNHLHWDVFEKRLSGELPKVSRLPTSRADALALVEAQVALVRDYVSIHVTSLLFANLFWQLLDGALANVVPEEARRLMDALATCPPGNRTLETNDALFALAAQLSDAEVDALEAGRVPDSAALADFLAGYGHRSAASWEVFTPRWADEPWRIVPLLRAHRSGALEEPAARAVRQEKDYEAARAELRALLVGSPAWLALVDALVHYTRRYLLLRENQRFCFDRLLVTLQRTLYWLGDGLVEDGTLDDRRDVALVTWEELRGGAVSRNAVARRRAEREEDAREEPPVFLRGEGALPVEAHGARLQGLGISPGRHRGRVRVVRSLAEGARLARGDVLVARSVDPAWTPLFLTAGAVILEMGSRLSHGAVVAREYRIPAVVNIEGVTTCLEDGQEVTVDGGRGVVFVHPR